MKIYTVHGYYDYEDNEILGVFDSKEKADQKQKELEQERSKVILGYDGYYIEEHEVQ